MIHALVMGTLWKDPEQRTSKSTGNTFTCATLRVKDGDSLQWIKLLAFGTDAQSELMRPVDGDAVSVAGLLSAEIYQPPGRDARINIVLFADVVLALHAAPKPKPPKAQGDRNAGTQQNDQPRLSAEVWKSSSKDEEKFLTTSPGRMG